MLDSAQKSPTDALVTDDGAGTADNGRWKRDLACVSCYKTLEELHQFNAAKLPFEEADALSVKALNYWPVSSDDPGLRTMSAMLLTQQYVRILSRAYVLTAQVDATWKDVMRAMEKVLVDEGATVGDLAATIDDLIKFEDE